MASVNLIIVKSPSITSTAFRAIATMMLFVSAEAARADGPFESMSGRSISMSVRTIQAKELLRGHEAEVSGGRSVDSSLSDLRSKFEKLPFKTFKLVDSQEQIVPIKRKETLRLPNGQVLIVRPLSIDEEKASIWLKWQDKGGEDLLDTRMHFGCGESMLTGVDSAHDSGVILAISVKPATR